MGGPWEKLGWAFTQDPGLPCLSYSQPGQSQLPQKHLTQQEGTPKPRELSFQFKGWAALSLQAFIFNSWLLFDGISMARKCWVTCQPLPTRDTGSRRQAVAPSPA